MSTSLAPIADVVFTLGPDGALLAHLPGEPPRPASLNDLTALPDASAQASAGEPAPVLAVGPGDSGEEPLRLALGALPGLFCPPSNELAFRLADWLCDPGLRRDARDLGLSAGVAQ